MMGKKMLVFNTDISGMNKYLFDGLKSRGWVLDILDVPYPKRFYWMAAVKSFHPSLKQWKQRFDRCLWRLYKSSQCFKDRSKWCERRLVARHGTFDAILNISSMYAPCLDYEKLKGLKYYVICSYTMALARKWADWMTYDHEYPKWVELEKSLYRNAEKVLTTNDNARFSIQNDYGVGLFHTLNIGYGLTFDKFPVFEKKHHRKMALYVGFDFRRKGGDYLLEAFKTVRRTISDAELVIIGPSKKTYEIAQDGVMFLGPVLDRGVVQQYFKEAAIFVMPSICEPFGLTFLEAMAYKLPCVGTKVDAMPEIICEGETGLLVEPRDPDSLAKAMIELLANEEQMERMGAAAYERVRDIYQWDLVIDRLEAALATR